MIIQDMASIEALPAPALGFLPALHDASVTLFTGTALPAASANANQVFRVSQGVLTPNYESWPAMPVEANSLVGSDGRLWYPVVPLGTTNTYYPQAFERVVYTIPFSAASLPMRTRWTLDRQYSVRLFANNTDVSWNAVWEFGDRVVETSPAPTGPNIKSYAWRRPLLDEQMLITDVLTQNEYGIQLEKKTYTPQGAPVYEVNILRYGRSLAAQADQLPLTEDFVLRLRLSQFDILDGIANPRGFVAYVVATPQSLGEIQST